MSMKSKPELVVLIGASRSGTTWLHSMLGAHPEALAPVELMLFNFYTQKWMMSWERQMEVRQNSVDMGLPHLLSQSDFEEGLREFAYKIYDKALETKPQAKIVVDKHPGYSEHVEHIDRLFPKCRFIHMIRDGRDVTASLLAASQDWARVWAPGDLESAAKTWVREVEGALKARQFQNRYHEVRYEELLEDCTGTLAGVFEFLGLEIHRSEVQEICERHSFKRMKTGETKAYKSDLPRRFFRKGKSGNWKSEFSGSDLFLLNAEMGPLLKKLHYAGDSWWMRRRRDRLLLPLLYLIRAEQSLSEKIHHFLQGMSGKTLPKRLVSALRSLD